MTEYWKSQARKYCEFCNCWFADNKVSISFHENGKKHKENVQKHISQLTKKSSKDAKKQEKIDDDMKKMEAAAMAAYLKDVQNNADLTSQSINEMLGQSSNRKSPETELTTSSKILNKTPVWQEIKNEDGNSYYWNTETNETTWDQPDEYVSLAEQEKKKLKEEEKKQSAAKSKQNLKKAEAKEALKESKAFVERLKMKDRAVKKEDPVKRENPTFGPAPKAIKPYGSWTPVVNEPEEKIDLQLPKSNKVVVPPPVVMEPETVEFREKRVETLGEGPVEFKKRKLSHKRSMRQKLDND